MRLNTLPKKHANPPRKMNSAKRILLVDDDADDQLYFRDAINELCKMVECEIANNGREAQVQIGNPPPPDIIFLDLNMPLMNGYEFLDYLKKEDAYKNIPVVIFTTSKEPQDVDRVRQMGAHLFFTKPTNFNILCSKLDKILDMNFSAMEFSI
ncbi:response regulator [soil metagenome]